MTPHKPALAEHKRQQKLLMGDEGSSQKSVVNGHYRMMEWSNKESSKSWKSTIKSTSYVNQFNFSRPFLKAESFMTSGEAKKIKGIL